MPVRRPKSVESEAEVPWEEDDRRRPTARRRSTRSQSEDEVETVTDDETAQPSRSSMIRKGSAALKELRAAAKRSAESRDDMDGDFLWDFRWGEDPVLVKFLDDEPAFAYREHWVQDTAPEVKRRGLTCYKYEGSCPLCELGERASEKFVWTVVDLSSDEPRRYWLNIYASLAVDLDAKNSSERYGPLSKNFWALSRTGKPKAFKYDLQMIKPRDLEEDWGISEDEIDEILQEMEPGDEENFQFTPLSVVEAQADYMRSRKR